jgi:hypothetical protein
MLPVTKSEQTEFHRNLDRYIFLSDAASYATIACDFKKMKKAGGMFGIPKSWMDVCRLAGHGCMNRRASFP